MQLKAIIYPKPLLTALFSFKSLYYFQNFQVYAAGPSWVIWVTSHIIYGHTQLDVAKVWPGYAPQQAASAWVSYPSHMGIAYMFLIGTSWGKHVKIKYLHAYTAYFYQGLAKKHYRVCYTEPKGHVSDKTSSSSTRALLMLLSAVWLV
jgi:hypothetical protein